MVTSNRGVVSAASYEARKYGVHSAMPIFQAKKKCPQGVFIPPRISRYKTVSKEIMALLRTYTPVVEPVSIYKEAKKLLDAYPMKKQVRLIGVGVSGLVSKNAPTQLGLFDMQEKEDDRWKKVDKALDSISQKFGKSAVKRATLKTSE